MSGRTNPFPPLGTQQDRLLRGLLGGDIISPISAIVDYNVMIPAARCAELRRLGWPIEVMYLPHPNRSQFPDDKLPSYFMDRHFRAWISEAPEGTHPSEYKFKSGRGKFADA